MNKFLLVVVVSVIWLTIGSKGLVWFFDIDTALLTGSGVNRYKFLWLACVFTPTTLLFYFCFKTKTQTRSSRNH